MQKDHLQYKENMKNRYFTAVQLINQEYHRVGFTQTLDDMLHDMGFEIVQGKQIDKILLSDEIELLVKRKIQHLFIYMFKGKKNNYIHIQAPFDEYLLIDKNIPQDHYSWITKLIFISIIFVFVFISFTIFRKLYPLNELKEKVEHFGSEDIEFKNININGKDEVSLLAHEFKLRSDKIKKLKDSRNVFIRNIMHELKTPITKGRFLLELPQNEENRTKQKHLFHQMESLISEFASIEEVLSRGENIDTKEYFFNDILDNALDILMIDDETKIDYEYCNFKLKVNFKLFSTVVKNLIDNGVKFSPDSKVSIKIQDDKILFINRSQELKYPLEFYFEPFFNSEQNDSKSFGLGIYIVYNILKAHKFDLNYEYKDGNSIFAIGSIK